MQPWMPDWNKMMEEAPEIQVPPGKGYVYLIADSHLGDVRAPTGPFFDMLGELKDARLVVFLGDLFKVWLAMPKFWDKHMREILAGFQTLRDSGVPIMFIVGNREFFLPQNAAQARRRQVPFDHIVNGACVLRWGKRRYGLTHGDIINRADSRHLKWRRFSRGKFFEILFRIMPGWLARAIAHRLERGMAKSNMEIKVQYPLGEIKAFAETVISGLDGFFVGHFHRDEVISVPNTKAKLRIVPDWHSRRIVLRLDSKGKLTVLRFQPEDSAAAG